MNWELGIDLALNFNDFFVRFMRRHTKSASEFGFWPGSISESRNLISIQRQKCVCICVCVFVHVFPMKTSDWPLYHGKLLWMLQHFVVAKHVVCVRVSVHPSLMAAYLSSVAYIVYLSLKTNGHPCEWPFRTNKRDTEINRILLADQPANRLTLGVSQASK